MNRFNNKYLTLISIVMPVFNAEKYLKDALNSVLNQTFKDFECVIVNDGSTDKSQEIIDEFINIDKRFRCYNIRNSGCANIPRNIAINNSKGNLIFNLDADDAIDLDCLEKMYRRKIETNAEIILQRMIGCSVDLEGELWRLPLPDFSMNKVLSGKEACALTVGKWKISCNGMLVKKNLFKEIPVEGLFNSDEIASRHLLYKANVIAFSDSNYYYRNHTNSITRAISPKLFERAIIDSQLDVFITSKYLEKSGIPKQARKTRFFNLIYLQADYVKYFNKFKKAEHIKIKKMIKKSYNSQNFKMLRNELPMQFVIVFLSSFFLFRITAILYSKFKNMTGSKYILE